MGKVLESMERQERHMNRKAVLNMALSHFHHRLEQGCSPDEARHMLDALWSCVKDVQPYRHKFKGDWNVREWFAKRINGIRQQVQSKAHADHQRSTYIADWEPRDAIDFLDVKHFMRDEN